MDDNGYFIIIPVQHYNGRPSQSNWARKRNNRRPNQIGKSKIVDDMILYTEIPGMP